MGNCLFGGLDGEEDEEREQVNVGGVHVIKVITSNGGIMEFISPITAGCIVDEFPGDDHAIFPSHDLFWKPVNHHQHLSPGKSYYLLPLNAKYNDFVQHVGHIRSSSIPTLLVPPYRMSLDYHQGLLKRSYTDVLYRYHHRHHNNNVKKKTKKIKNDKSGIWKVKLVISPQQLLAILSEEGSTQELIESVRTVAKCRNIVSSSSVTSSAAASMAFSDEWSLSSSRNASSKNDMLLLDI